MVTPSNQTPEVPATEAQSLNASRLLLPYTLALIASCTVVQLVILARGSTIDLVAGLALVPVALLYAWFIAWGPGRPLRMVRFGPLVAHAVTYVIVNAGFQLHAAVLALTNSDTLRGDEHVPILNGWLGPTWAMAGFWALGFVAHAIASISQRGYEK